MYIGVGYIIYDDATVTSKNLNANVKYVMCLWISVIIIDLIHCSVQSVTSFQAFFLNEQGLD